MTQLVEEEGSNAVVFAYGPTGTGKTHTMGTGGGGWWSRDGQTEPPRGRRGGGGGQSSPPGPRVQGAGAGEQEKMCIFCLLILYHLR